MSLLKVENLSFSYGDKEVLKNINFSVKQGELFCLAGANGCGKTTLQKCILNIFCNYSGNIIIDGKNIKKYTAYQLAKYIAYVPQSHQCSFGYKVWDVVLMGAMAGKSILEKPAFKDYENVENSLKSLGIYHLKDQPYNTLSGGELQMVFIARALCQQSEIIIFDEPTSHLDFGKEHNVLQKIASLARDMKKTIIISTHDLNQPLYFQDEQLNIKTAIMAYGQIFVQGVPTEVLAPENIKKIYGLNSAIHTIKADRERRYIVTW